MNKPKEVNEIKAMLVEFMANNVTAEALAHEIWEHLNNSGGNSLRDEVKDAIRESVLHVQQGDQINTPNLFDEAVEIAGQAADKVFDLLHIDDDKQDMNYEKYMTA